MSVGLAVVVVTHNGAGCIAACLESVLRFAPGAEMVVVDNASTDGTVALVRERFPDAQVTVSPTNVGFGSGCRIGIERSQGDVFLLLNQDAALAAPIDGFVGVLRREERLGVLGGRVSYPDGRLQPTIGRRWTPRRLALSWLVPVRTPGLGPLCARVVVPPSAYDREQRNVAWVSGAFLLGRRAAWDQAGGFDPAYFMYVEDVDYADRIRRAGYQVGYSPLGRAVHAERGEQPIGEAALRWTSRGTLRWLEGTHGERAARRFAGTLAWIFRANGAVLSALAGITRSERRRVTAGAFARVGRELGKGQRS